MTLDDFRAMPIEQLNAWLREQNAELATMHDWIETNERVRALAYKALKEKMLR